MDFRTSGSLVLDASASFHELVAGFGTSDQIDLEDVAFVSAATTKKGATSHLSFTEAPDFSSGTLTVTNGAQTASIRLLGMYTASELVESSDGHGGTLITFEAPSSGTTVTGGKGHGH